MSGHCSALQFFLFISAKTSPAPNQSLSTVTQTISFCYDSLGRATSKWYTTPNCASPSSAVAQYAYDQTSFNGLTITNGIGRRTSMTDPSGSSGWSYDTLGRVLTLKRQIGSYNRTVSYQYNVGGLPTLVTTFNGDQRQYSYSGAGDATAMSDPTRSPAYNFVTSASYTPGGALAQAVYGHTSTFAGVTETGVFNTRLQPCWFYATTGTALPTNEPCNGSTSAANVIDLKFNFNAGTNDNGNVIQVINNRDNNRTQNFLYDSLNRIQQAYTTGPNWGETFSPTATAPGVAPTTPGIDAWGNLTNRSGVTGKTNSESALNCAPANVNNQLNTCFGYDAAGNLTSNGGLTYTYDAENRLSIAGGATYTYDGDGNRVKKMTGSTGTIYWREASGVTLTETDATNTVQHSYIFFAGRIIARTDHQPSWSAHFYFSDHLGSSNVVTNASGTIEDESDFYPYGGEIVITNNVPQNYKFTGKERDSESGFDNFGARYYASGMGRFMTPDWAARPTTVPYASFGDPQSLNLYTYVENAPVNRADADGHDAKSSCTGWANYATCRQRQMEEAKIQNTKNQADAAKEAAKPQPKSLSAEGLVLIQSWEKLRSTPYTDGDTQNRTIGYGHKILQGEQFTKINEEDATKLLMKDVSAAVNAVNKSVTTNVSQNQFDALVSLAFNAGAGAVSPHNTIVREINNGQTVKQSDFTAWNHVRGKDGRLQVSRGLTSRRLDEFRLFARRDERTY